jgi:two-component system nitrogen regulation response regulator GlnG
MAGDDSLATLESRSVAATRHAARSPALTIAYHPDLDRVGEQARIGSAPVDISRTGPEFVPPHSSDGRELADRHLSRKPVRVRLQDGGARVERMGWPTRLAVDGTVVRDRHDVPLEALDDGVVIELGDRIVLVLHQAALATSAERGGLIGVSDRIAQVRDEIGHVAAQPVPVLLRGASGVGKELAARALHDGSLRNDRPFVSLNMATINAATAASELFGHEAGAFTGAQGKHDGCFIAANGGTLFLDEIGATTMDVQAMLLRTLETGEVRAVGASEPKQVDVRVISATDLDLEAAVDEGAFRLPLLHRLAVYEVTIPPLSQRRCDIGVLLVHFLREALGVEDAERLLTRPTGKRWLPADLVASLAQHDWPGNVRQLRNVARQLVIWSRDQPVVQLNAAVQRMLGPQPRNEITRGTTPARRTDLETISDQEVHTTLRRNRFKVAATARELGISKHSMYLLMDRSKTIRKAKDLSRDEIVAAQKTCGGDLGAMAEHLEVSRRGLRLRLTALGID